MRPVHSVVYRYLTNADFYNMYKPRGSEVGGGGQTYIDFPTQDVSVAQWEQFLNGVPGVVRQQRTQGPAWTVPIGSIGHMTNTQPVLIYRRRPQSVSVANQTLNRPQTNRVEAWHPRRRFPVPSNPNDRRQCPPGLAIYLVRATDNTVWAGWFLNDGRTPSPARPEVQGQLRRLFNLPRGARHRAGIVELPQATVWLDETNIATPFHPPRVGAPDAEVPPPIEPAPSAALVREQPRRQVEQRRERGRARATDAGGYQLDPKRRKAVELYAMQRAKEAYPGAADTSATESYDLRTRDGGSEVRVEVKGTLGGGDCILVTANEIDNAFGAEWRTDLFIVSDIQLTARDGEFVASGGRTHTIRAWLPSLEDLRPTQYRYRVPR